MTDPTRCWDCRYGVPCGKCPPMKGSGDVHLAALFIVTLAVAVLAWRLGATA